MMFDVELEKVIIGKSKKYRIVGFSNYKNEYFGFNFPPKIDLIETGEGDNYIRYPVKYLDGKTIYHQAYIGDVLNHNDILYFKYLKVKDKICFYLYKRYILSLKWFKKLNLFKNINKWEGKIKTRL